MSERTAAAVRGWVARVVLAVLALGSGMGFVWVGTAVLHGTAVANAAGAGLYLLASAIGWAIVGGLYLVFDYRRN